MKIGIMARTFFQPTLTENLDAIVSHGLYSVQFSFGCVGFPELPEKIDLKLCDDIREDMEKHKIEMSAMSGTFNMIDPDISKRKDGLKRLIDDEQLRSFIANNGADVASVFSLDRWRSNWSTILFEIMEK